MDTKLMLEICKIHPELELPDTILESASIAWDNYSFRAVGCTLHWDDTNHTASDLEAARPQNT